MIQRSCRLSSLINPIVFLTILISFGWVSDGSGQTAPVVWGRVGIEPYPDSATVTYIAYLKKGGETDNQILTEDNRNAPQGPDQGYNGRWFQVDTESFSPLPADNDTLVVYFTGIGAETGNAGDVLDLVDIDAGGTQIIGNSTWGASSNPSIPSGLSAENVSPGVVDLSWDGPKNGTHRIYRSSQASGAGNGRSNGRFNRIAKDISGNFYRDSTAPQTICWYIIVAVDSTTKNGILLSGHTDEVSIDAALPVELTSFTATGGANQVILEWVTESEWDNQGFYVERREDPTAQFERITPGLIAGAGNSSESRAYSWVDHRVENDRTYWYQLVSVDFTGGSRTYGPVSATPAEALPRSYGLFQNYPNPFNPETWILYQLPEPGLVSIKIYNVRGQQVNSLREEEQSPGIYRVRWDGRNQQGDPAASGVYFCRMISGPFTKTIKMILLR